MAIQIKRAAAILLSCVMFVILLSKDNSSSAITSFGRNLKSIKVSRGRQFSKPYEHKRNKRFDDKMKRMKRENDEIAKDKQRMKDMYEANQLQKENLDNDWIKEQQEKIAEEEQKMKDNAE